MEQPDREAQVLPASGFVSKCPEEEEEWLGDEHDSEPNTSRRRQTAASLANLPAFTLGRARKERKKANNIDRTT